MGIPEKLHIPLWLDHGVREAVQDERGPLFIAAPAPLVWTILRLDAIEALRMIWLDWAMRSRTRSIHKRPSRRD